MKTYIFKYQVEINVEVLSSSREDAEDRAEHALDDIIQVVRRNHKVTLTPEERLGKWLEEYKHCGCSHVAATKAELMGYCSKHANDRRRITKLPKAMPVGYAGVG